METLFEKIQREIANNQCEIKEVEMDFVNEFIELNIASNILFQNRMDLSQTYIDLKEKQSILEPYYRTYAENCLIEQLLSENRKIIHKDKFDMIMEENGLVTKHISEYRGRIPLKNIEEFDKFFNHERFKKAYEISHYKQISALPSEFAKNSIPQKKYDPIITFLHDEPFKYLRNRIQIVDIVTAWGEEENLLDDFTIKNIL